MEEFAISRWAPPPRWSAVGRPLASDAKRKARLYLPAPALDDSTPRRLRESEQARAAWARTPIPTNLANDEVARWMWEDGQRDCALCERPIDIETVAKQHPGRIELDHVHQRTWGGQHTWGNVRPVHRGCNQFRGGGDGTNADFLPQQYRRALNHSLDYYNAPDKPRAKLRRHFIRIAEKHHRLVEWWELDLAAATTEAERERIERAIAWNRREMERASADLAQLDLDLARWDAQRLAAAPVPEERP